MKQLMKHEELKGVKRGGTEVESLYDTKERIKTLEKQLESLNKAVEAVTAELSEAQSRLNNRWARDLED